MEHWPALPLHEWRDTKDLLHMYAQVVGKIRMAQMPPMNQQWHVTLYVTARGLTTGPMPHGDRTFELTFDLIDHVLEIATGDADVRRMPLGSSVRGFYRELKATLEAMGLGVKIWPVPVEVANPVPFEENTRKATYDPAAVETFWRILAPVDAVFKTFRARFTGKCSPVHFFWGSFDLAVTRFSGKPASPTPEMTGFMRDAYNAELLSLGFWPGGDWPGAGLIDRPMFYSYTFPRPEGLDRAPLRPAEAGWNAQLGEFVLWYDDVRAADHPVDRILDFAQSTYEAGARLSGWPIESFELRPEPAARIVMLREEAKESPAHEGRG